MPTQPKEDFIRIGNYIREHPDACKSDTQRIIELLTEIRDAIKGKPYEGL